MDMKTRRYGLTIAALLFAPSAFAITLKHHASLDVCTLDKVVHGHCTSTSVATFFDKTSSIDIDCRLYRDGPVVAQRVENVPAADDVTRFKTKLHTPLYYDRQYCVINRSKYRLPHIFYDPTYLWQDTGRDCDVYKRPIIIDR